MTRAACSLPQARPDYVKQQLLVEGLELEEFGGSVQLVHTSVKSGLGLSELSEALLLQVGLAGCTLYGAVLVGSLVLARTLGVDLSPCPCCCSHGSYLYH